MNRIVTALAIFAIGTALTLQGGEVSDRHQGARGRQTTGAQHRPSATPASRPASRPSARPAANGSQNRKEKARPAQNQRQQPQGRPANNGRGDRHESNARPQQGQHQQQHGLRPGAGGNQGSHNRPAPPAVREPRPHHGGPGYGDRRPGGRPGQRPTPPPRPHYGHVPAPHRPWSRPVPPPHWRAHRGVPSVGTVLGLTLGTAFNATLNYLIANNYTMTGYTPEEIVLASVPMYGFTWPTARLLYNNGLLYGSQYVYPTAYYDNTRYNALYGRFCNTYGMPVTVNNTSTSISTTWFGANGGFITLSLEPIADRYGRVSYYTAVTMGN